MNTLKALSSLKKNRPVPAVKRSDKGFSLLELLIAMFILIILLSIALPTYQRNVQHARETVLKENLWQMRRAIDQFSADKGRLPASLQEIVDAKYLRDMPIDPVTEKPEWEEVYGEDSMSPDGQQGLKDVKSLAGGQDGEGRSYSEY
ncbi:MAG: prepilin-type N-terminal cleavage/methylation domain-containing protein [Acidobacteria bacterium]|nr:prepilin-type N-terminal cleavage/methylation domain-containing protein [Acidobacteriota bacterium]